MLVRRAAGHRRRRAGGRIRPPLVIDDGGRKAAGFRGEAGDCACRALAIAWGKPYREVYDRLNEFIKDREPYYRGKVGFAHATGRGSSSRTGVHKRTFDEFLDNIDAPWTPCMKIGTGCRVHVRTGDLPATGRYILRLSKHFAAWIDGVLHDTYDSSREGTRCVYGYWTLEGTR
ncbi:MAG TPA: hypothetical protein VJP77_05505 [Planctomycetota bacterium]|nr:hypothetical protein [Planctomycetota bacterium]